MILYIDGDITLKCDTDTLDACVEAFEEFGVSSMYRGDGKNHYSIVNEQKIVLNELDMNRLFQFFMMVDLDISYGGYGCSGCDFSITIKQRKDN